MHNKMNHHCGITMKQQGNFQKGELVNENVRKKKTNNLQTQIYLLRPTKSLPTAACERPFLHLQITKTMSLKYSSKDHAWCIKRNGIRPGTMSLKYSSNNHVWYIKCNGTRPGTNASYL